MTDTWICVVRIMVTSFMNIYDVCITNRIMYPSIRNGVSVSLVDL